MKRKKVLILLALIFLCLSMYSGYRLFAAWREYSEGEEFYNDLSQYIQMDVTAPTAAPTTPVTDPSGEATEPTGEPATDPVATEPPATSEPTAPAEEAIVWPVVDFEALRAINPDIVAWIYIPDTNINYPVVCGEDNDYYLHRLIDGTYNSAGSIFMDYRNDRDLVDENTVLYGHHMQNQSMFAHIAKYVDQSFYDSHTYGMLLTPEGNYLVEFFSGYVTGVGEGDAWTRRFSSEANYAAWLNRVAARSYFSTDVTPTAADQILTLSTCTFDYDDARFVLHGVLRPVA